MAPLGSGRQWRSARTSRIVIRKGDYRCRRGFEADASRLQWPWQPGARFVLNWRKYRRRHVAAQGAAIGHLGMVVGRLSTIVIDAGDAERIAECIQHWACGHGARCPCYGKRMQHKGKRRDKRDKCPGSIRLPEQFAHPLEPELAGPEFRRKTVRSTATSSQ